MIFLVQTHRLPSKSQFLGLFRHNLVRSIISAYYVRAEFTLLQLSESKKVGELNDYHNVEPFTSQRRLRNWPFAFCPMNNKPLLIFQSRIGLLCSPQKEHSVPGRVSRAEPPQQAPDSRYHRLSPRPVTFSINLFISINKQLMAVNENSI